MKIGRPIFIVGLLILSAGCTKWAYKVPTEAMVPTIKPGDTIWVDYSYYKTHPVERFDIVLFKASKTGDPFGGRDTGIVKRVIALGGEEVEIRHGKIFIDRQQLTLPFDSIPLDDNFKTITVPEEEYFLLGDNRANSYDSRYWSRPTLKQASIEGKVVEIKHN